MLYIISCLCNLAVMFTVSQIDATNLLKPEEDSAIMDITKHVTIPKVEILNVISIRYVAEAIYSYQPLPY